jgi:hypothetical protein
MQLRYGDLETALAKVVGIKIKDRRAFRAKLRHLRNIGLPRLPRPGSGQPIAYSRHQALEMLIALELEKIGQAPKNAALLAQSIARQPPQFEGKDCYIVVSSAGAAYMMGYGSKGLFSLVPKLPHIFLVINLAACVRKLDSVFGRASIPD